MYVPEIFHSRGKYLFGETYNFAVKRRQNFKRLIKGSLSRKNFQDVRFFFLQVIFTYGVKATGESPTSPTRDVVHNLHEILTLVHTKQLKCYMRVRARFFR